MAPEWVAVPTVGMRRWLALELARTLGASPQGAGDGVAANIRFSFPGALRQAVLEADRRAEPAASWRRRVASSGRCSRCWKRRARTRISDRSDSWRPGATWFGRARRLADLFDRYSVRRPELILAWQAGHDVDATGRPLADYDNWQPHLWRLLRAHLGVPSPPEVMPGLLEELRSGALAVELPAAPCRLRTHDASGRGRVHRAARGRRLGSRGPPHAARPLAGHELAGARGCPRQREAPVEGCGPRARLWSRWPIPCSPPGAGPIKNAPCSSAEVESASVPEVEELPAEAGVDQGPASLLARLQSDLRAGRAPTGRLRARRRRPLGTGALLSRPGAPS